MENKQDLSFTPKCCVGSEFKTKYQEMWIQASDQRSVYCLEICK